MNKITNIAKIADYLEKTLKSWKISYSRKGSELSDSVYIEICENEENIKIRISDHDLPPTYGILNGYADIEIFGNGNLNRESGSSYFSAIAYLSRIFGKKMPAHVKKIHDADQKIKAEKELKEKEEHEEYLKRLPEIKKQIAAESAEREALKAAEEWAIENSPEDLAFFNECENKISLIPGKNKKKKRAEIRRIKDQRIKEIAVRMNF